VLIILSIFSAYPPEKEKDALATRTTILQKSKENKREKKRKKKEKTAHTFKYATP
jgi:hypothetical protein